MNDFTKEELQYFLMIMKPFHWLWKNDPIELKNKIQSMIDNYCEHHFKVVLVGKKSLAAVVQCHKCGYGVVANE